MAKFGKPLEPLDALGSKAKPGPAKKSSLTPKGTATKPKGKQILSDGETRGDTRGDPLALQQGLMGALAGGLGQLKQVGKTAAAGKKTPAIGERPIPPRTQSRMLAAARSAKVPGRR